eukprot:g17734.t1
MSATTPHTPSSGGVRTSQRGRVYSPKEHDEAEGYTEVGGCRRGAGGMVDRRGTPGGASNPVSVWDSSMEATPGKSPGSPSRGDGEGGDSSDSSSSSGDKDSEVESPEESVAGKTARAGDSRKTNPFFVDFRQTRALSRAAEKEYFYINVHDVCPEKENKEGAKKLWVDVAKKVLVPTDLQITRGGLTTKVRVDYQRGRPEQDPNVLGENLRDTWGRHKRLAERKEKRDERKTGEGLEGEDDRDAEDPAENSELAPYTRLRTTMKASSTILFGAAVVLLTATLATADEAESPANLGRKLRRKGRGKKGNRKKACADPVQAVLDLLECISVEDGECAAAAYDPGFQRFHNEEFTGDTPVYIAEFLGGRILGR